MSTDSMARTSTEETHPDVLQAWRARSPSARPTSRSLILELACIDEALREPDVDARPHPWAAPDVVLNRRAAEISRLLREEGIY